MKLLLTIILIIQTTLATAQIGNQAISELEHKEFVQALVNAEKEFEEALKLVSRHYPGKKVTIQQPQIWGHQDIFPTPQKDYKFWLEGKYHRHEPGGPTETIEIREGSNVVRYTWKPPGIRCPAGDWP